MDDHVNRSQHMNSPSTRSQQGPRWPHGEAGLGSGAPSRLVLDGARVAEPSRTLADQELRERIDKQLERLDLRRRARRALVIGFAAASVGVLGALDGGEVEDAVVSEDASFDCQDEQCQVVPMYGSDFGCSGMKRPW